MAAYANDPPIQLQVSVAARTMDTSNSLPAGSLFGIPIRLSYSECGQVLAAATMGRCCIPDSLP